ncbi:MAG: phosphonate ABC transporter ATP-binding protein [Cyanobacteria bacterium J06639_1]
MLYVECVSKTYEGDRESLRNVSFKLPRGQFVAVLGSSGAGKSTLLRAITRQIKPERGRIELDGLDFLSCSSRELQHARSQVATIAQQFNLVRRRTALENCLAGRLQELPFWRCCLNRFPDEWLRAGLRSLSRVDLQDVAFQRADRLSGGQQQRVAIARALMQNARLILADEPVASLDPASSRRVLEILRSLCHREGLTVLCSLHQVELALAYSDRILGLRDGQLVADCPTRAFVPDIVDRIYGAYQGRPDMAGTHSIIALRDPRAG